MGKGLSFSDEAVKSALDAAKKDAETAIKNAETQISTDPGQFTAHAECVTATVENGQICIDLPLGLGHKCISIPTKFGDGTKAQACLDICTKFGVPTGVKVYVTIDGITVAQKTFGVC